VKKLKVNFKSGCNERHCCQIWSVLTSTPYDRPLPNRARVKIEHRVNNTAALLVGRYKGGSTVILSNVSFSSNYLSGVAPRGAVGHSESQRTPYARGISNRANRGH
jgi:hypothetical protein